MLQNIIRIYGDDNVLKFEIQKMYVACAVLIKTCAPRGKQMFSVFQLKALMISAFLSF